MRVPGLPEGKHLLDFEDDERIGPVCWCGGCAEDPCMVSDHEAKAYTSGLMVAFGVMGMADAIRENAPFVVDREYWTSGIDGRRYYTCHCPGCGAMLKRREAGVHEGTDLEWCGVCRDSF